ncbi:MAG TPA: BMP family ABC transporter substrate-binding protein [Mycobacteriales bacterium]|jgi:basic membrane protein A|nr:BMP family ABC transporter substrate-binding protein [Mycobacteriales bacterium]
MAALLVAVALIAAACGGTSTGSGGSSPSPSAPAASSAPPAAASSAPAASKFLACEVTDTGGINDRSFNASAYQGLKVAAKAIPGIQTKFLQSNSTSDYTPNINTLIGQHCGIIITVGFDMAAATQKAAKANPNQKFAIVDFQYAPPIKNVKALSYETNQDGFLGGYLAAAMSKSGKVGTFGGQNIPTVTIYMDGWVAGVRYFNKVNNAHVSALGWIPKAGRAKNSLAGSGLFTNDFTNQALGKTDTQTLLAQGADIIFPVAGSVGLGAAAAVKQAGGTNYMEWVDTDGCVSAPQYCSLFITSVNKGIAVSVSDEVEAADKGTFTGGTYVGTLKNGGVGLAPFHQFASKIPASVTAKLATIKSGIESGTISVDPNSYPAN